MILCYIFFKNDFDFNFCFQVVSKASIESRTKTLAMGIKMSESNALCLVKLERLCNHLVQYPESSYIACKVCITSNILLLN